MYKLQPFLTRRSLLIMYKFFVRPHCKYAIHSQLSNASFSNKIELVQYNPELAIKGAIKGSPREKLYQEELELEYL